MAVKIRLSRIGKKHAPFSRIVAVDSRKKRDGAFLEDLGTYDVLKTTIVQFKPERISDWMSKGAVMTDAVKKIQKMYERAQKGVVETPKAPKIAAKKAVEVEAAQNS